MTDAAPKAKKAGPSTGDADGKKRFEVKKVWDHKLDSRWVCAY